MDSVFAFRVFVQVARSQSLVAAGAALGLSASAVGKSLARLEQRAGARLFHRNTRSLALTAEGARFLERCLRIIAEVDAAAEEFTHASSVPSGRLRISLPLVGEPFVSLLADFQLAYRSIAIDADFTDRPVDLVEEGYDAVIRSGDVEDSRLVSKRLGGYRMLIVASPDYLARRGAPQRVEDLPHHDCIQFRHPNTGKLQSWGLADAGGAAEIRPPASAVCNSIEARIAFAVRGVGLAYLADFTVREHIASGRLVPVLTDLAEREGALRMLWASAPHPAPKLRALIDYASKHLVLRP